MTIGGNRMMIETVGRGSGRPISVGSGSWPHLVQLVAVVSVTRPPQAGHVRVTIVHVSPPSSVCQTRLVNSVKLSTNADRQYGQNSDAESVSTAPQAGQANAADVSGLSGGGKYSSTADLSLRAEPRLNITRTAIGGGEPELEYGRGALAEAQRPQ